MRSVKPAAFIRHTEPLWRVLQVRVWLSNLHTHRVIDNHHGKWLTASCVFLRSFEDLQECYNLFPCRSCCGRHYILTAATQEPAYATCFIMMYARHPDTRYTYPKLLSVRRTISIASMNCSFLIVLAFTFTQYVVVISPLNYAQNVTKRRVIICVLAIYVYSVLFSVLPEMGVSEDAQRKIDNTFHSICLIYFTVIIYILLFIAFKKKIAASNRLREDKETNDGSKDDRRTDVERKFITVNFLLIAILFLTSQPAAMFWIAKLYSSEDPNSPKFLIINLMLDNLLYLKFLLDPFVYTWRIPKYRQALMIVLRCGKDKPERSKFSNRVIAEMSKSRETVITLDFKQISNF